MSKLLTVQEVADYLRVSDQTVHGYIKRGELPATKVGRFWRVEEAAVKAFTQPNRGTHNESRD